MKILLPTDFSPLSRSAIQQAVHLAAKLGGSIEILHVLEPLPEDLARETLVLGKDGRQVTVESHMRQRVSQRMEEWLTLVKGMFQGRVRGRVEHGNPAETISRVAEEGAFDLIAIATRGRSGLSRLLVGSVAEEVVRHATVPVLTVREQKEKA